MDINKIMQQLQFSSVVVNVTHFTDDYIKLIQDKEGEFEVILSLMDNEKGFCLCKGMTTNTVFVEFIEQPTDLFRL